MPSQIDIQESRKFGLWDVYITREGQISIIGEWLSNFGIIYGHYIERFKNDDKQQIIGMDNTSGLRKDVLAWIHDKVREGRFDHLIPKP